MSIRKQDFYDIVLVAVMPAASCSRSPVLSSGCPGAPTSGHACGVDCAMSAQDSPSVVPIAMQQPGAPSRGSGDVPNHYVASASLQPHGLENALAYLASSEMPSFTPLR